jgi:4-diphosphocytidyl-2-C-methyl-D-erythritol kinase
MAAVRSARVHALAKLNLDLRVLDLRPDGYHELRTVFQTISLHDTIDLAFTPARRTRITVASDVEIPGGNIMERAAAMALDAMRVHGHLELRLAKRIPMGAGLGGGSSDAAAVLLALPVLAGKVLPLEKMLEAATALGSDVPFFLLGGTALALGRGTELYPLPDRPPAPALVVAPSVHVSTREAYRALDAARRPPAAALVVAPPLHAATRDAARHLTSVALQNMISSFQSIVWEYGGIPSERLGQNDFEAVVFAKVPRLKALKRQLEMLGASPAMLSGSGSALFGLFGGWREAVRAAGAFGKDEVFPVRLVTRRGYRALWWRQLGAHLRERVWPPQSRYA